MNIMEHNFSHPNDNTMGGEANSIGITGSIGDGGINVFKKTQECDTATKVEEVDFTAQFAKPSTLHCPGSVPLPSVTAVFDTLAREFPGLKRIPDGETGIRKNYISFQVDVFSRCQWILKQGFELYGDGNCFAGAASQTLDQEREIVLNDTGYAVAALASYAKFKKARDEGVVRIGTRFQVSLPVPYEVITYCIQERYQVEAEKLYECLIISDLQAIQAKIPAKDLAIQFDTPFAVVFLEGLTPTWFAPSHHREKLKYELGKRFDRMASFVNADVELGFHLCYGDYGHKHFMEPVDTSILVELSNLIHACVSRTISWMHLPVPISRDDDAYFEPLRDLKLRAYGETELYLGCIHRHDSSQVSLLDDIKGTERRIAAAVKVLGGSMIGVSTECGWGRYSQMEFLGMIEVTKALARS